MYLAYRYLNCHSHHSRRLHLSPQSRKEKEDTHRAFSYTTAKVSVGPEHCPSSPASKQLAWQMGS
jgi:hypothetical protein